MLEVASSSFRIVIEAILAASAYSCCSTILYEILFKYFPIYKNINLFLKLVQFFHFMNNKQFVTKRLHPSKFQKRRGVWKTNESSIQQLIVTSIRYTVVVSSDK